MSRQAHRRKARSQRSQEEAGGGTSSGADQMSTAAAPALAYTFARFVTPGPIARFGKFVASCFVHLIGHWDSPARAVAPILLCPPKTPDRDLCTNARREQK